VVSIELSLNISAGMYQQTQLRLRHNLENRLDMIREIVSATFNKGPDALIKELAPLYLGVNSSDAESSAFEVSVTIAHGIHVLQLDQGRESGHSGLVHPAEVAYVAKKLGLRGAHTAIGFLHDTLEDGTSTITDYRNLITSKFNSIQNGLGNYILFYVEGLSAKKHDDLLQKKIGLIEQIKQQAEGRYAKILRKVLGEDTLLNWKKHKVADSLPNLLDLEFMGSKEGRSGEDRQRVKIYFAEEYILPIAEEIDSNSKNPLSYFEYLQELIEAHKCRISGQQAGKPKVY